MGNTQVTYEVFEQLEKRLNGTHEEDRHGFYRTFRFEALGVCYRFTFFKNLSYLHIGDVQINFTHVSVDGYWPNSFKTNLNLGSAEDVLAVIPLEKWPKRG